ncbi:Somatostatin receptor type 1 [Sarcoptes scabiei]|nr:Somatostatin receptor type 1 [Sarcoptes scabiei]
MGMMKIILAMIVLISIILIENALWSRNKLIDATVVNTSDKRRLKINSSTKISSNDNNNQTENSLHNQKPLLGLINDHSILSPFKDNFFFKRQIIYLLIPQNNLGLSVSPPASLIVPPGGYYGNGGVGGVAGDVLPPTMPETEALPPHRKGFFPSRRNYKNRLIYRKPAIATIDSYAF